MSILSGALFSYPQDSLFWPSTKIAEADTPDYSFHFERPHGLTDRDYFDKHFFLDNGAHVRADLIVTPVTLDDGSVVNLGDHRAYYYRLFRLRTVAAPETYYLVPWLTVAYQAVPGGFAAVAAGSDPTTPAVIRLAVKPFSIYETRINADAKAEIEAAAATGPRPQLTLHTPPLAEVSAAWAESGSAAIDEVRCVERQDVLITIPQSISNPYPEQLEIDIKRGGVTMGRVCLLFLATIPHQLIVFKVSRKSYDEMTVKMLGPGPPAQPNQADICLEHVQGVFAKVGIGFTLATPSLTYGGQNAPCDLQHDIDIRAFANVNFLNDKGLAANVLEPILGRFLMKMDPLVVAQYAFVFLIGWGNPVSPVEGRTEGISKVGLRISCVWAETRENTCHEVGHALALPHYFYEADGNARAAAGKTAITAMQVATRKQFYDLHDLMNSGNACVVFNQQPHQALEDPALTPAQEHFYRFNLDRYTKHATSNLMDYRPRKSNAAAPDFLKEDLVKHQIDALRFMVTPPPKRGFKT